MSNIIKLPRDIVSVMYEERLKENINFTKMWNCKNMDLNGYNRINNYPLHNSTFTYNIRK